MTWTRDGEGVGPKVDIEGEGKTTPPLLFVPREKRGEINCAQRLVSLSERFREVIAGAYLWLSKKNIDGGVLDLGVIAECFF